MRFDNINYTRQQVRGGHFGSRNNVFIEQKNIIMQGPTPPKMNFWQGLLTGLTGGSIFGGFGMGGMFGGCGMPGMFGGCGMGSIFGGFGMPGMFGGFGMGGFSPFGLGSFGMQGGALPGISQGSSAQAGDGEASIEKSVAGLKAAYPQYNISNINGKITVTSKDGSETICSGKTVDEAQEIISQRNGKADVEKAKTAKQEAEAEKQGIVKEGDKWVKKGADGKVEQEYTWDSTTETFKKKPAARATETDSDT